MRHIGSLRFNSHSVNCRFREFLSSYAHPFVPGLPCGHKDGCEDQRSTGEHWVTAVYEIKSLEPEATTRQSSEVAVDAADRDIPLIPLGPFAEIRGGSSAMQAFAGVCAAMVASTLLEHTALRGIIESERLDRLDLVHFLSLGNLIR